MTLHAHNVSWRRGGALVIDDVTLHPKKGETVGLLGPNGSGKSSLLHLLQAGAKPDSGIVTLDDTDIHSLRRRHVARRIASVTQHASTDTDITVRDVVRLGRTPHRPAWSLETPDDKDIVDDALERVKLTEKADQPWRTLSGGERQRAHIARALAQEPHELLMDEPTNHLDIRHQLEILHLVTTLNLTSIIALHDLSLAAMFCDNIVVLKKGRVMAAGAPEMVLTPELIREVYEVEAEVSKDPKTGLLSFTYQIPSLMIESD